MSTGPLALTPQSDYNACALAHTPSALASFHSSRSPGSRPLNASIIIRAKNEIRDICDTLTRVYGQVGVPAFEVIVVDSGSTDGSLDVVQQFEVRLIQIRPESFTYGRALNIGVAAASGEFVVSLSAHALPAHERWLATLLAPFADPTIAAVYGREFPRANATALELFGMRLCGVMSPVPRRQERDMMFSNRNGAYRRQLLLDHPFDEKIPGAEDLAWADWIQRQGWAVAYEPEAPVYHSHGESLLKLLRRMAKDQPTIIGLKMGMLGRRPARQPRQPAPACTDVVAPLHPTVPGVKSAKLKS